LGEAISRILNVLSIDIYELAAMFGVELSDVVDWYSEKCDCDEIFKLIQGISNIADKIDELNIPQIGLFIRRPIFDGNSLLSLIKEQKDSPEIVNDLNQALAKIKSLADEKKSARKNRAESYKQEISQFKPLREINEITEIIDERG
jgi:hemerythrin-like domain-containing protein